MTLAIGALGAGLARQVHLPMFMLTGPALAVAFAGFAGLPVMMAPMMRNIIFVVIGVAIGASMDSQAGAAMLKWPLAFGLLAIMLVVIIWSSSIVLQRYFGFDRQSAVLASAPGHLTYVLGLGLAQNADMTRVSVVQSVRLLALTFSVPLLAEAFGIRTGLANLHPPAEMGYVPLVILLFVAILVGVALDRLRLPAALLIAGMLVSTLAQLGGFVKGAPSADVMLAGFIAVGSLLGCRLSVLRRKELAQGLFAGLATTAISVVAAVGFAYGAAWITEQPMLHVVVAFAPGGLETMVAIGAILGANAGFVAACHVIRLFILTGLVPLMLGRAGRKPNNPGAVQ